MDKISQYEHVSDYAQSKEVARWQRLTDRFQLCSVLGLFIMMGVVGNVSKDTAHWLVWYLAALELIMVTITFFITRKFQKLQHDQWDRSTQRVKDMHDRFEQERKTKIR